MSIKVEKSSVAIRDFTRILNYFLDQNAPDAGLRFVDAFDSTLEKIADLPDLGSRWESGNPRLAKIRYWPIKGFVNYLVFYQRFTDVIVITHVLHASQDIERVL